MLQVNELDQYYGGSHILRGLTFEARVGEVTCLLGRNGVGKTTLLKCLIGLVPIKNGSITWEGKILATSRHISGSKKALLMSPRERNFPPAYSGREYFTGAFTFPRFTE